LEGFDFFKPCRNQFQTYLCIYYIQKTEWRLENIKVVFLKKKL
jgi:hypothetical protein